MRLSVCSVPRRLPEQPGKQGNQGDADEGDPSAGHKLLHSLALGTRVVVSVTFQEVDRPPDTEASPKGHHEGLKYTYRRIEECHKSMLPEPFGRVSWDGFVSGLQKPERTASWL